MNLGEQIIEMLERGYGINLYWLNDALIIKVSKEDKIMKHRMAREDFNSLISRETILTTILHDNERNIEEYKNGN